jgi:hypothetical protein
MLRRRRRDLLMAGAQISEDFETELGDEDGQQQRVFEQRNAIKPSENRPPSLPIDHDARDQRAADRPEQKIWREASECRQDRALQ